MSPNDIKGLLSFLSMKTQTQNPSSKIAKLREKKYFGGFRKPLTKTPNLVISQVNSFKWLVESGLKEIFEEFSPIKDFSKRKFELDFTGFELAKPKNFPMKHLSRFVFV